MSTIIVWWNVINGFLCLSFGLFLDFNWREGISPQLQCCCSTLPSVSCMPMKYAQMCDHQIHKECHPTPTLNLSTLEQTRSSVRHILIRNIQIAFLFSLERVALRSMPSVALWLSFDTTTFCVGALAVGLLSGTTHGIADSTGIYRFFVLANKASNSPNSSGGIF